MDPEHVAELARPLAELAKVVADLIARAAARPRVESRVVGYLEAAREAVRALGRERQDILADVRRCEVHDAAAVEALSRRLDTYLHVDRVRPLLVDALGGLRGCFQELERRADTIAWRRRDRRQAFLEFTQTLQQFELLLEGLTSNFLPGASGMGVDTLIPIHDALRDLTKRAPSESDEERLGELAAEALAAESNTAWFTLGGQVETLVLRLQFAFKTDAS